jgi:hypothetical protein
MTENVENKLTDGMRRDLAIFSLTRSQFNVIGNSLKFLGTDSALLAGNAHTPHQFLAIERFPRTIALDNIDRQFLCPLESCEPVITVLAFPTPSDCQTVFAFPTLKDFGFFAFTLSALHRYPPSLQ